MIEPINSYAIKLSGEAELPEPLENNTDYLVSVEGSVTKEEIEPNYSGGYERVFKFRPLKVEVLKNNGQTVKSIDRLRQSQKIRIAINNYRKQNYSEIDEESFYNSFTGRFLANFEEVAELLKKSKG